MDTLLLPVFATNIVLILIDASIGYHLAPVLFRAGGGDPETAVPGVRSVRRLLTGVVVLYMFFNCLGYFRYDSRLLLLIFGLVLFDLGGQLYIRRRSRNLADSDDN